MNWREDKTLVVLCCAVVAFTGVFLVIVYFPPRGDVALTTSAALLSGSFTALMKHLPGGEKATPPGSTTVTNTAQVTETPPDVSKLP